MSDKRKKFAIISLGFLGDTLLVEPLCQNIKNSFPDSKIVFIVSENFADVPLGFEAVDKVYSYDKRGLNGGILGYLNFCKNFDEEKIDYAIITHPHERSILLAKMIGAKKIVSLPSGNALVDFLITDKRKYIESEIRSTFKPDYNNGYLKNICRFQCLPVNYNLKNVDEKSILNKFLLPEQYIVLSPTSKDLIKDWTYTNIKQFILGARMPVVLIGTGKAKEFAMQLQSENIELIDLSMRTTLIELSIIIKNSTCCVSVDTGTFHLAYAQKVNTIGIFYREKMVTEWAPVHLDYVKVLVGERQGEKDDFSTVKDVGADEVLAQLVQFDSKLHI